MSFEVGDQVFQRITNPAVGIIRRVAKDKSWADVHFLGYGRPTRVKTSNLENVCPVINYWLKQDGVPMSDLVKTKGPKGEVVAPSIFNIRPRHGNPGHFCDSDCDVMGTNMRAVK